MKAKMISVIVAALTLAGLQACSDGPAGISRAQPAAAPMRPAKVEEYEWLVPGLSAAGNSLILAWNRHDAAELAALWHEDGDFVDGTGRNARGRSRIEALFLQEFGNTKLEFLDGGTEYFVGRDLRLEDWNVQISGGSRVGGPLPPARAQLFLLYARGGSGGGSAAKLPATRPTDDARSSPPGLPPFEGHLWLLAGARVYTSKPPAGPHEAEVPGPGPDAILRVEMDVTAPKPIFTPPPAYPEIARKARLQGTVLVDAVIDREGNVIPRRLLRTLPMGLDRAALDTVRKWKFKPATLDGRPVNVYYVVPVVFQLQDAPSPK
jgi:TonB family protein